MATRIYLPSSGSSPITLTYSHGWTAASGAKVIYKAVTSKGTTALTTVSHATGNAGSATTVLCGQYVIGPLSAQTISGTIKGQIRATESNSGANATVCLGAVIVTSSGTLRATLLSPAASDSTATPPELYVGSDPSAAQAINRSFNDSAESASISLSSQSAQSGDYLVIEVGFRTTTGVNRTVYIRGGDNSSSDLPEDNTSTNDYAPWVEFSGNISFATAWTKSVSDAISVDGTATPSAGFAKTVSDSLNPDELVTRVSAYSRSLSDPASLADSAWLGEFDIPNATYYAVAPSGYSYNSRQDSFYSTRKYTTLAAAEAAVPANPTTSICINILGEWTSAEDAGVSISGIAAQGVLYVRALGAARHTGKWTPTAYRIAPVATESCLECGCQATIDGLQLKGHSGTLNPLFSVNAEGVSAKLKDSLVFDSQLTGVDVVSGSSVYLINSAVYDVTTAVNCTDTSEAYAFNCVLSAATDAVLSNGVSSFGGYNCYLRGASDSGTGTVTLTDCTTDQLVDYDRYTFQSVDAGSEDFHLAPGSQLYGAGDDHRSSYPEEDGLLDADIDGTPRTIWSIGIDEGELGKSPHESIGLGENIDANLVQGGKDITDTLILGETLDPIADFSKSVSDDILFGENVTPAASFDASLSAAVEIGESVSKDVSILLTEAISVDETLTKSIGFSKTVSDAVELGDIHYAGPEFGIAGATYYAVAPSGYSYSDEQTSRYSTRKYTSMVAAESALPASPTTPIVINILGTWSSADSPVTIDSMTPTATNYLHIRAIGDARHKGVWSTTAYRNVGDSFFGSFDIRVSYVTVEGVQAHNTWTMYNYLNSIGCLGGSLSGIRVLGNIARGPDASNGQIISISGSGGVVAGNLVFTGRWGISLSGASPTNACVANNTVVGCVYGLGSQTAVDPWCIFINNLVYGCTNACVANMKVSPGSGYNATDKSSFGYTVWGGGSTTGDRTSQTFKFASVKGTVDYHLSKIDAGAYDYGTDASAYWDRDIDGDLRTVWSIGADDGTNTVPLSDAASISETISKSVNKALSDALQPGENITKALDLTKSVSDAVELGELLTPSADFTLSRSDAISIDGTSDHTADFASTLSDSIGMDEDVDASIAGQSLDKSVSDGLEPSETVTKEASFAKSVSEPLEPSENLTKEASFSLVKSDALLADEQITKDADFSKSVSDPLEPSEVLTKEAYFEKPVSDSAELVENVTASIDAKSLTKSCSDELNPEELLTKEAAFAKTVSDALLPDESITKQSDFVKTAYDDAQLDENITKSADFSKPVSEVISIEGSSVPYLEITKHTSDELLASEQISSEVGKAIADALDPLDSVTKEGDFTKTVSDSARIDENLVPSASFVRQVSDPVSIEGTADPVIGSAKSLTETLLMGENFTPEADFIRTTSDTIEVVGSVTKAADYSKTVSDAAEVNSDITKSASFSKLLSDSVELNETIDHQAITVLYKDLSDALTPDDDITKVSDHVATFSEPLGLDENFDRTVVYLRLIGDDILLNERRTISGSTSNEITEEITLGESVTKKFGRSISDSISVGDSVRKAFSRRIRDTFGLTDGPFSRIATYLRYHSNAIKVTDRVFKSLGYARTKTDPLTLGDRIYRGISVTLSDSVSLGDSLGVGYHLEVDDQIGLSEDRATQLFRLVPFQSYGTAADSDIVPVADRGVLLEITTRSRMTRVRVERILAVPARDLNSLTSHNPAPVFLVGKPSQIAPRSLPAMLRKPLSKILAKKPLAAMFFTNLLGLRSVRGFDSNGSSTVNISVFGTTSDADFVSSGLGGMQVSLSGGSIVNGSFTSSGDAAVLLDALRDAGVDFLTYGECLVAVSEVLDHKPYIDVPQFLIQGITVPYITPDAIRDYNSVQTYTGSDSGAYIPNIGAYANIGDFTIEFWLRRNTYGDPWGRVIDAGWFNAFTIFTGDNANEKRLAFNLFGNWAYSNATIDNGTWAHIAMVRRGSYIEAYINGALDRSDNRSATQFTISAPIYIGKSSGGTEKYGVNLTDIRFWNRALDVIEISERIGDHLTPSNQTGLIGNWQFFGSPLADQSSNDNSLVLNTNAIISPDDPYPRTGKEYAYDNFESYTVGTVYELLSISKFGLCSFVPFYKSMFADDVDDDIYVDGNIELISRTVVFGEALFPEFYQTLVSDDLEDYDEGDILVLDGGNEFPYRTSDGYWGDGSGVGLTKNVTAGTSGMTDIWFYGDRHVAFDADVGASAVASTSRIQAAECSISGTSSVRLISVTGVGGSSAGRSSISISTESVPPVYDAFTGLTVGTIDYVPAISTWNEIGYGIAGEPYFDVDAPTSVIYDDFWSYSVGSFNDLGFLISNENHTITAYIGNVSGTASINIKVGYMSPLYTGGNSSNIGKITYAVKFASQSLLYNGSPIQNQFCEIEVESTVLKVLGQGGWLAPQASRQLVARAYGSLGWSGNINMTPEGEVTFTT